MADTEVNNNESVAQPSETEDAKQEALKVPSETEDAKEDAFKIPMLIGPKLLPVTDNQNSDEKTATSTDSAIDSIPSKPKEQTQNSAVIAAYKPPSWSGIPDVEYKLEVLKGGVIVDKISLSDKPCHIIGRMTACDVVLEHPSISRNHAAITHRVQGTDESPVGYYLYDLKSTHGTWLNKQQIEPRCYYRLRVGYMIKFGGSSRVFIVQGPEDDQEEESELTVTELKELRKKQEEILERQEQEVQEAKEVKNSEESDAESGIDWGMGEDADEEADLRENPFALDAIAPNEELYVDDPKKTLRGWFEREGYTLEYKVEEKGYSQFLCRIELPLDSPTGQPLHAEASVKGKKKEAVIACALEACRILDRHGLLRQATHESRKRKERNWEDDDYYDSDEDTFLDRTGTIEKKRQQRIHRAGKEQQVIETYDTLLAKLNEVQQEIKRLEIVQLKSQKSADVEQNEDADTLDAYMEAIKNETSSDKCSRTARRLQLLQLKQEEMRLQHLVNFAAPANLPEIRPPAASTDSTSQHQLSKKESANEDKKRIMPDAPKNANSSLPEVENDSDEESVLQRQMQKTPKTHTSGETQKLAESSNPKETSEEVQKSSEETTTTDTKKPVVSMVADSKEQQSAPSKVTMKISSRKKVKKQRPTSFEYDESNPDYAMWLPPEGQTGDGRTRLNDKYGY